MMNSQYTFLTETPFDKRLAALEAQVEARTKAAIEAGTAEVILAIKEFKARNESLRAALKLYDTAFLDYQPGRFERPVTRSPFVPALRPLLQIDLGVIEYMVRCGEALEFALVEETGEDPIKVVLKVLRQIQTLKLEEWEGRDSEDCVEFQRWLGQLVRRNGYAEFYLGEQEVLCSADSRILEVLGEMDDGGESAD